MHCNRCCPDVSASGGGATCLVLPREKLDEAIRKDDQLKRSLLDKTLNNNGNASLDMETQEEFSPRVSFGGPEPVCRGVVVAAGVAREVGGKEALSTEFDPRTVHGNARGKVRCPECFARASSSKKKGVDETRTAAIAITTASTATTTTNSVTAGAVLFDQERQHYQQQQDQGSGACALDSPARGAAAPAAAAPVAAAAVATAAPAAPAAVAVVAPAAAAGAAAAAVMPASSLLEAALSAGTAAPTLPPLPRPLHGFSQANPTEGSKGNIYSPATRQPHERKPTVAPDATAVETVPDPANTIRSSDRQQEEAFLTSVPSPFIPSNGAATPAEGAVTYGVSKAPAEAAVNKDVSQLSAKTVHTNDSNQSTIVDVDKVSQSPPVVNDVSQSAEAAVANDVGRSTAEKTVANDANQSTSANIDISQSPSAVNNASQSPAETAVTNDVSQSTAETDVTNDANQPMTVINYASQSRLVENDVNLSPFVSAGVHQSPDAVTNDASQSPAVTNVVVSQSPSVGCVDDARKHIVTTVTESAATSGVGSFCDTCNKPIDPAVSFAQGSTPSPLARDCPLECAIGRADDAEIERWPTTAVAGDGEERGDTSAVEGWKDQTGKKREGDGVEEKRRRDLMDSLTSFISFHVDPFKVRDPVAVRRCGGALVCCLP